MALAAFICLLGLLLGLLSGFLGIGGGIVMAPALLYLPRSLGLGLLDMKAVSGLTITQGLAACVSGALRHRTFRMVHRRLVLWMGGSVFVAASIGSFASRWVSNEILLAIFASLAVIAAIIMLVPKDDGEEVSDAESCTFNVPTAVVIASVIGVLGGLVGQGGSFILIPLMLHVLRLPTRVVVGSNLAIVFLSSLAGFIGKAATRQLPPLLAAALVAGAVPGAQIGALLSRKTKPKILRRALGVVVLAAAGKIVSDLIQTGAWPW